MKKITCIFLSFIFLASCTNFSSLGATPIPQAPFTLTPTFTPTITPTITSTPTETPDPNKPSDATGKDSSTGDYIKTVEENGKSVVYIWKQFQFGDDVKNGVTGHWFKSWMANGPINLTGYGENCEGMDNWGVPLTKFIFNMNVYAIEGQADLDKVGYIFHPDRASVWENSGLSCGNFSLPYLIMNDLFLQYINLLPGDNPEESFYQKYLREREYYAPNGIDTTEGQQRYYNDHKSFAESLTDGSMKIKVGDDEWTPNKGYEIYWINEDMALNDSTFHLSLWQYPSTKHFYWKIIIEDGKLIAFIAPTDILKKQLADRKDEGKERWFRTIILFPVEAVNIGLNTNEVFSLLPQNYGEVTGTFYGTIKGQSLNIDIPFIDFTPTQ